MCQGPVSLQEGECPIELLPCANCLLKESTKWPSLGSELLQAASSTLGRLPGCNLQHSSSTDSSCCASQLLGSMHEGAVHG